ncbi:MAG: cupin domain-containing protein [Salibacteraceae bacterium]
MSGNKTEPLNLDQAFARISELWTPYAAFELNGQHVRLARLKGEFVWHKHEHEDELFYVYRGELTILFEGKTVTLCQGEMLCIPRNTMHKPVAADEAWVVLFEPVTTINTGNADSDKKIDRIDKLNF